MLGQPSLHASRLVRLLGPLGGPGPTYARLARAIEHLVLDGRLPPQTRLPSERDLASALRVSRTTTTTAYAQLREGGYLSSRRGSGSRTSLPMRGAIPGRALMASQDESDLDLAVATPPAIPGFVTACEAALADLPRHTARHGYEPQGLLELRTTIAERYAERGLPTDPGQIIVTGGALAAWDLVLRHLTGPGDRVLVEHPTYPNALRGIELAGARAVPVAVDSSGWDTDMLDVTVRQANPRLAYLVPDFQNPTGQLMDGGTRLRVAKTLGTAGTACVIDESMVELPLDIAERDMPAPFAAYTHGGRAPVLHIGGGGKPFWGGLCIGWVRAPSSLVRDLLASRTGHSLGTPVLDQLVLTHLLADRAALLEGRRQELRERRDHLIAALRRTLPSWAVPTPVGGLVCWCAMPEPLSPQLAALAARQRVLVAAGPKFGLGSSFERFVRLPYTVPEARLDEAVRCLAWAYTTARAEGAGRRAIDTFVA